MASGLETPVMLVNQTLDWENELGPVAQHYMCFWPNAAALRWGHLCWRAVTKAGQATYLNDEEEMQSRELVPLAAMLYAEFAWRGGWAEHRRFRHWSPEIWKGLASDCELSGEQMEERFHLIVQSYLKYYGDDEAFCEMWLSCVEGASAFPLTHAEIEREYTRARDNHQDVCLERARSWLWAGDYSLGAFEIDPLLYLRGRCVRFVTGMAVPASHSGRTRDGS
jgi:hypothetical protein